MKTTLVALVAIILVSAAGCASSGNASLRKETESSVSQKITEGKTTKEEVRAMFGSPLSTSFTDGGLEIWKFELAKMSADAATFIPFVGILAGGSSGTKKELVVMFDEKGIVKRRSMSESPVKQNTGLLNQ